MRPAAILTLAKMPLRPRAPGYGRTLPAKAVAAQGEEAEGAGLANCKWLKPGPYGDLAGMRSYIPGEEFGEKLLAAANEAPAKPRRQVIKPRPDIFISAIRHPQIPGGF